MQKTWTREKLVVGSVASRFLHVQSLTPVVSKKLLLKLRLYTRCRLEVSVERKKKKVQPERHHHSPGSMFGDVLETPDLSPVVTYSEDSVYHL